MCELHAQREDVVKSAVSSPRSSIRHGYVSLVSAFAPRSTAQQARESRLQTETAKVSQHPGLCLSQAAGRNRSAMGES